MTVRLFSFLFLVFASFLASCASVPEGGGFDDVEKIVGERTSKKVIWNRNTEADQEVSRAVHAMLQRELSLDDAVQIALLNNRNLQAVYEELGVAQADLVQAGLLKNPTLGFEMRFPGRPASPLEVHLLENFIDLFFMPLKKRLAAAAFEAAKFRVADAVLNTAAEVKRNYYQLQAAGKVIELRRNVLTASEASALAAQRLYDAGNITDLELSNEQVTEGKARLALVAAEEKEIELREELNQLLGLWGEDTTWAISQNFPELPPQEIGIKGLETLAVSKRLDLAAARQEIEIAAQSMGIANYSGLIPELTIGAHLEREPDGTTTLGPSLDIPIPIFDQGQATQASARSRLRQTQNRYIALGVEVRSQVRKSWNRVSMSRSRAESYSKSILPLRRQIVEKTQLEYNAMLIGVFQLLQAKQSEIEANREYIEALSEYWSSTVELEKAVGGNYRGAQ